MPINMPASGGNPNITCGACKWFHKSYKGSTCVKTREVEHRTIACVEFTKHSVSSSASETLSKDKYLQDIEGACSVFSEQALKAIKKELNEYKLTEHFRHVPRADTNLQENLQGIATGFDLLVGYLERVCEIRGAIADKLSELNQMAKDAQSYLLTDYPEMFRTLKNESERNAFVRAAIPALSTAIDQTYTAFERADEVYKLLKDSHFNLARAQEVRLELWKSETMMRQAMNLSK